jgi:hypothetical protein
MSAVGKIFAGFLLYEVAHMFPSRAPMTGDVERFDRPEEGRNEDKTRGVILSPGANAPLYNMHSSVT